MSPRKATNKEIIRTFWQANRQYKTLLFLILFLVTVASVVEVIVPLYYKKFFDELTLGASNPAATAPLLVGLIFLVLALNGIVWLAYRVGTFFNNIFLLGVMTDLKRSSFDYLLQHSYDFFSNNFVGSLVQKVNRLSRSFERLSDRVIWEMLPLFIRITGVVGALWFINKIVSVIMFVWAAVFILFNYFFSSWKLKYDLKRAEADSRTTGVLADDIANQTTIKLFTGLREERERFREVTEDERLIRKFTWDLDAVVDAVQSFLVVAAEFLLFYFAIRLWRDGLMSIGSFVLIQAYLISLVNRMWNFTRIIRDFYQSFADAEEMVTILQIPHEIKDAPAARELEVKKGEIIFQNLEFSFNQTRKVLRDFNLTIRPGEKIALIGPSGAGKSTIIRLLFRFHDAERGAIKIDGQDIKQVTQESLRRNLSLVPQDPILFHRTLKDNIRYGRREASDDEIYRAANLAHCREFIEGLNQKYDTYVGERGVKLSGGERQRVAIARAIVKNAPILVLDEATSSLDSESEALIKDALKVLMKGKTSIVIAHRLSTIRQMDRIVVIDDGRVAEEGTHTELISRPGSIYRRMWKLQAGGFLPEERE